MQDLLQDILMSYIFPRLPIRDLTAFRATCKRLKDIPQPKEYWYSLAKGVHNKLIKRGIKITVNNERCFNLHYLSVKRIMVQYIIRRTTTLNGRNYSKIPIPRVNNKGKIIVAEGANKHDVYVTAIICGTFERITIKLHMDEFIIFLEKTWKTKLCGCDRIQCVNKHEPNVYISGY